MLEHHCCKKMFEQKEEFVRLLKEIKLNENETRAAKKLVCMLEKSFGEKKEMLMSLVNSVLFCAGESEHAKELAAIAKCFLHQWFCCNDKSGAGEEEYDYAKLKRKIELIGLIQSNCAESPYSKELAEMVKHHLEQKFSHGCASDKHLMMVHDHEAIAKRKKELVLLIQHCQHQSPKAKRLAYMVAEWMNYFSAHCPHTHG